jgi:1-acyl-sn-glycerol-3-phosphate acyltransferase
VEPWNTLWLGLAKAYLALLTGGFETVETARLPQGPKIFVSNHPSITAVFAMPFALAERMRFLMQADVFTIPVIGPTLRWAGHIAAEKGDWAGLVAEARARLRQGISVFIYPEGQMSPYDGFWQPHSGAVRLALATGLPVVPVGLYCASKHLHTLRMPYQGRMRTGHIHIGGKCFVRVGPPWYPPIPDPADKTCVALWSRELMDQVVQLVGQAKTAAEGTLCSP